MKNLGEIQENSTVTFLFTTHNAAGAPVAPSAAFVAADFVIYKDASAVQRTSAAGVTITSPFDTVVGLHLVSIDLSDNTDAGFYSVGSNIKVVLNPSTTTVDGQSVLAEIANFDLVSHKTKQQDYFNSLVKATCVVTNTSATQAELPTGTYGDLQGAKLWVIAGTGVGQSTTIESFNDTTDIAVFNETLSTALDGTSVVLIEKDGRSIIDSANPLAASLSTSERQAIMTAVMTEAYPADGVSAITPAQAMYAVLQLLSEFARTGTTVSVKKRDGTEAFTLLLDSATEPTTVNQAS